MPQDVVSSYNKSVLVSTIFLIGRALLKIQRDAVNQVCLIASAWHSQLLTMLVDHPILLSQFP